MVMLWMCFLYLALLLIEMSFDLEIPEYSFVMLVLAMVISISCFITGHPIPGLVWGAMTLLEFKSFLDN